MATATKVKAAEPQQEKVEPVNTRPTSVPVIPSGNVSLDWEGFQTRHLVVRAPENFIQDDLRNPGVWKNCQADRNRALQKLDSVTVLASDESWFAECTVVYATSTEARLLVQKVGRFREADAALFRDDVLEVFFDGAAGGYSVRRTEDHARVVSQTFSTEAQAIAALQRSYSTAV